jgi:hypothetical protein
VAIRISEKSGKKNVTITSLPADLYFFSRNGVVIYSYSKMVAFY